MRARRSSLVVMLLFLLAATTIPGGVTAAAGGNKGARCANPRHPGGDWPSYGQNLSNTRAQDREKKIDPSNLASLAPAWSFTATAEGGAGSFQTTPVVAEGCVYMTTGAGHIYALNADSGKLVWKGRYAKTVEGVCCGSTLFAPTVKNGVLYVNVARNPETAGRGKGPFALAIDAHTGKVIWQSESVATEPGAYTNTSVVLFDGLLFFGISGAEGGHHDVGGFALLDAKTGEILKRTHTVPKKDFKKGFGGGSIWATAAVDTKTRYAYVGTGQPTSPKYEHERINAIVKIDLDRSRRTFGEIVDSYKGTPDSRAHGQKPCRETPDDVPPHATCVYTDVDFGASPTLLRDSRGNKIVVEYQKSGVLHAAYADTMEKAWDALLAPFGHAPGNYTSTATDGKSVFGAGTYPGQAFSIDKDFGGYNWAAPVGTLFGANPMSYANGVVYHADGKGILHAWDAATGAPLMHRPMGLDAGGPCLNVGGGVAIARNTVYAVCGEQGVTFFGPSEVPTGWVIAYRLPD